MTIKVNSSEGLVRNKARTSRGPLHDMLTAKLPDLVDQKSKVLNLHKLADELNMTYQGVYKWFKPGRNNRLPHGVIDELVKLSSNQLSVDRRFKPMTFEDAWKFVST